MSWGSFTSSVSYHSKGAINAISRMTSSKSFQDKRPVIIEVGSQKFKKTKVAHYHTKAHIHSNSFHAGPLFGRESIRIMATVEMDAQEARPERIQ